MPLTRGKDSQGPYYRWGPAGAHGKKYHYTSNDARSRNLAKSKAMRQARAIEASKYRALKGYRGGSERKTVSSRSRSAMKVKKGSSRATSMGQRRVTRK